MTKRESLIWIKDIDGNQMESHPIMDMSDSIDYYLVSITMKSGFRYRIGKLNPDGRMQWQEHEETPQQKIITSSAVKIAVEELKKFVAVNGVMAS